MGARVVCEFGAGFFFSGLSILGNVEKIERIWAMGGSSREMDERIIQALEMVDEGATVPRAAEIAGISRATLYNVMRDCRADEGGDDE